MRLVEEAGGTCHVHTGDLRTHEANVELAKAAREQLGGIDVLVDSDQSQGAATGLGASDLHTADVDAGPAELAAVDGDDTRAVDVLEDDRVLLELQLERVTVDAGELLDLVAQSRREPPEWRSEGSCVLRGSISTPQSLCRCR